MIVGYKCFHKGLINRYGYKFYEGKLYHAKDKISFSKNGFHMCLNLEDTLRYFDAFNEEVDIALVIGSGNKEERNDEYNGYYNMFAVEYLTIVHVLTREEIINHALKLSFMALKRFISLYKLNKDEIKIIKKKYANESEIISCISYYQEKDLDVYKKKIL